MPPKKDQACSWVVHAGVLPGKVKRAKAYSEKEWDEHRDFILEHLSSYAHEYIVSKLNDRGFQINLNQLKLKLKTWGRSKNLTSSQKEYIIKALKSRPGKESSFRCKKTKEVLDKADTERKIRRYEQSREIQYNVAIEHESPFSVFTPSTLCADTPRDVQSPPAQNLATVPEEETNTSLTSIMMDIEQWPEHIEDPLQGSYFEMSETSQFQLPDQVANDQATTLTMKTAWTSGLPALSDLSLLVTEQMHGSITTQQQHGQDIMDLEDNIDDDQDMVYSRESSIDSAPVSDPDGFRGLEVQYDKYCDARDWKNAIKVKTFIVNHLKNNNATQYETLKEEIQLAGCMVAARDFQGATVLLGRIKELATNLFGSDSFLVLEACFWEAEISYQESRYEDAVRVSRLILGQLQIVRSDRQSTVLKLDCQSLFADSLHRMGDYRQSETECMRYLQIIDGLDYTCNESQLAEIYLTLTENLRCQRKNIQALDCSEKMMALEWTKRWLRENHPDAHGPLCISGYLLSDLGRFDEALEAFKKALVCAEKEGGIKELQALRGIASTRVKQGDVDESLRIFRELLIKHEEIGDEEGKAFTMFEMGDIYKTKDEYTEAIVYYKKALQMCSTLYGQYHPHTLGAVWELATCYQEDGQIEKAWVEYERLLPEFKRIYGEDGINTRKVVSNIERLTLSSNF